MADGTIVIDTSIDKKKIDSQVSSIRSNVEAGFKNIAKIAGAALATATAAVGAFAVSSVKDFIVFEDKMNEVFTLLPGASTAMKDSMMEDVKALSKEMGVLPEDVIPAVYQALSAGIPKENVFDFVRTSSKLATAGVAEMDDAVGVLTTVVNNYAKEGLTAEEASNMLFTAVKDGVTSVPELATKLGDVVPIAASLGIGFDEVAGATGAMTAIMGKGSTTKAVTNLRGMLNELGKEGTAADEAFQSVAGVGFTEFIEKGGTLQEAMGVLKTASIENNTSINNLFGSIEAGQAALILAGDGAEKFATVLDNMHNSTGATEAAFQTMTESAKFQIDKIKANVAVLKLDFSKNFMPSIGGMLSSIVGMFDGTEGATKKFIVSFNDSMIQFFKTVGSVISKVMPLLLYSVSYGIGLMIGTIIRLFPEWVKAGKEMLSSMVTGIQEKLPELIENGKEILNKIWEGLKIVVPQVIDWFKDFIPKVIDKIRETLPKILENGEEILSNLWNGLKENAPKVFDWFKEFLPKAVDKILETIANIYSVGNDIVSNMLDGINGTAPKIWTWAKEVIPAIGAKIAEYYPEILASGVSIVTNIIDGITKYLPNLLIKATEMIKSFSETLVDSDGKISGSGGAIIDSIIAGIGAVLGSLWTLAKTIIPLLIDAIFESSKLLLLLGNDIIVKISDGLQERFTALKEKAVQMGNVLIDGFVEGVKDLRQKSIEVLKAISDAIKEKTQDVIDGAKNIGVNLIDGFVKGFESIKDKVRDKIMAFFDLIPEGVRKLLGIKSPSKVFKGIGENVAEGFADGIEDGKAGVMRSAEDIAEVAVETVEASVPDAKQAGTNLANAVDQGVKDKKPAISTTWKSVLDDMSTNTTTWVDTITGIIGTLKGAFADTMTGIGEAIATGGLSWDIFAKAGLNALADVLKAIGEQLTAMAVLKLVQWDWSGAAIAGAGATAAFIASGYISSKAASYDVGGIIDRDQLANIHQGETILPKGITADMKSAGLMIQPLGRNSATSPTMYGIINLDGREIARAVFKHTDSNVGLAYTG